MKRLYFIFNMHSGKAAISAALGEIIDAFTKSGYEVTAHPTQGSDDTADSAEYAVNSGFDLIVCAGGDGTLSNCLNGIMRCERKVPLGYIPSGSTNDFAKTLGAPKSPLQAVDWVIGGKAVNCDVGKFNNDFFTYIVAFGAFTNVTYETSQQFKNILGHAAYVLSGILSLNTLRSKRMRIEYDGNVIEDDFIYGMVTNSASVAGLLSLSNFLLDDGKFEVTLIKRPSNPVQLQKIVHSLLNIGEEIDKEYIKFFRTDKITFTSLSDEPITWTRDGEYGGDASINVIENCHRAIPLIISETDKMYFSADGLSEGE
ncbi:MAG: diacylglycerol/lipid kinase family protein [Ruminococcus sp.]|nr:YegS/Rv2252/BmrU family lipid kinase [Oscillospiraceae bacterium]